MLCCLNMNINNIEMVELLCKNKKVLSYICPNLCPRTKIHCKTKENDYIMLTTVGEQETILS